ncbi:hypothetical protein Poly51_05360 [Rubripirellula tenax]|uniref:Uncharacterized protein n=1 Tax=Rubripirellula tenax TaxID=2528015 RepID=A0A5C6FFH7_9BACT|nr:hypothetical protein [Rubripirellula tenax]TWU60261.1 hypothetical protein Poly51_05360 [Rubripirellula tenax]
MHCVLIADLAALVSQHGPSIIYGHDAIPPEAMTQYWTTSRTRFELWHQTVARYRKVEVTGDFAALRRWWRDHIVVVEEVLVTEMLTRVIAALAAGLDREHDTDEISPITHAVFLTHLEARNRIQQLMLYGRGSSVHDTVRLNRLRQGVERWTDAMIGRLSSESPKTVRYAFDPKRAREYAEEARSCGNRSIRNTSSWLMNAAMHDTLRRRTSPSAALPEANQAVVRSVMLMLRPDRFDSIGTLKSLWLHRLQTNADRADRVLDELDGPDIDDAPTADAIEMANDKYFERWYM